MATRKAGQSDIRQLLLRILDSGFDRTSWHGPNLWGLVRRVTLAEAIWQTGSRKTIWQQALHAAYWKHRVLARLTGTKQKFPRSPANWPDMPLEPTPTAWEADRALLVETHRRLREAVAQLPDKQLNDPKTQHLIYGLAAHDVYHAGQIGLLRRMAQAAGA